MSCSVQATLHSDMLYVSINSPPQSRKSGQFDVPNVLDMGSCTVLRFYNYRRYVNVDRGSFIPYLAYLWAETNFGPAAVVYTQPVKIMFVVYKLCIFLGGR